MEDKLAEKIGQIFCGVLLSFFLIWFFWLACQPCYFECDRCSEIYSIPHNYNCGLPGQIPMDCRSCDGRLGNISTKDAIDQLGGQGHYGEILE